MPALSEGVRAGSMEIGALTGIVLPALKVTLPMVAVVVVSTAVLMVRAPMASILMLPDSSRISATLSWVVPAPAFVVMPPLVLVGSPAPVVLLPPVMTRSMGSCTMLLMAPDASVPSSPPPNATVAP